MSSPPAQSREFSWRAVLRVGTYFVESTVAYARLSPSMYMRGNLDDLGRQFRSSYHVINLKTDMFKNFLICEQRMDRNVLCSPCAVSA
jgi:hypothetical protein